MAEFGKVSNRKIKLEDARISVCTDCKFGIFKHQDRVWTNRGLVHEECEGKRILNEVETLA